MPATIVPRPGTDAEIWVNWLDDAELVQMNASESAGGLYAFGDLGAESDIAGPDPESMKVYVDCFGGLEVDGSCWHSVRTPPRVGRLGPSRNRRLSMRSSPPSTGDDPSSSSCSPT